MDQNRKQRSVNVLNETTLYFITKDNQVKSLNRRNKDMLYKDTQNNFFKSILTANGMTSTQKRGHILWSGRHGISDFGYF